MVDILWQYSSISDRHTKATKTPIHGTEAVNYCSRMVKCQICLCSFDAYS